MWDVQCFMHVHALNQCDIRASVRLMQCANVDGIMSICALHTGINLKYSIALQNTMWENREIANIAVWRAEVAAFNVY